MASTTTTVPAASPERVAELQESLAEIRARVQAAHKASQSHSQSQTQQSQSQSQSQQSQSQSQSQIKGRPSEPTLVAVSKIKPASDILACYELGQRDFGENYVQELEEKAALLTLPGIRWHFIGTLQSNKAKVLASIPNIYAIQTVTSLKAAVGLNKHIPSDRSSPLNILLQVNTSGEDNKSGLPPLSPPPNSPATDKDTDTNTANHTDTANPLKAELTQLALHIIKECPRLRLQGLMTIGSLTESLTATATERNRDFETLKQTRDVLQQVLERELPGSDESEDGSGNGKKYEWGVEGRLLLSMGMSSDFEAALKAGGDIVRVGTGIFGARPKKGETPAS